MNVCHRYLLMLLLLGIGSTAYTEEKNDPLVYRSGNLVFEWNIQQDKARVNNDQTKALIWQGSLLPSFWLEINHKKKFIKCSLASIAPLHADGGSAGGALTDAGALELRLLIGQQGRAGLVVKKEDWGIRFSALEIEWTGQAPAIIEMYFGASDEAVKSSSVLPTWDRPFMPDWQSFGYCVPGAKEGPAQSYFRYWDFGLTNIALGSFGPSTGVPYGAAYPKPVYYAGMGSNEGFIAMGAGSIPDAAMSLRVQSTRGCFQYVYNEDIWGALPGRKRIWTEPLRISLGTTALAAFKNYYRSFPARVAAGRSPAPAAFFNTWGLWKERNYTIEPIAAFAKQLGASILVLDDGWESFQGSGIPNTKRFPNLAGNLGALHDSGMTHGIWETLGWIDDTAAAGLRSADLIVGRNGRPCKANWNFDPTSPSYYCLDISSAGARDFLKQRTLRMMHTLKPSLIKLDFGYGFPSPAMGVPRNPIYRGERQYGEIVRLIAETAKSVDPAVTIMYYSISPLCLAQVDMVSLDDQGDLWYDIAGGHGEWSIWASLLSDKNVAVSGSSGYSWEPDEEVILNTAIIGNPGASLPISQPDGKPIAEKYLNRRLAINKWFRKTVLWEPLWLNSRTGDFNGPPRLNCWGRIEKNGEDSVLTALVLRDSSRMNLTKDSPIRQLNWKGRWALISQDNKDIFSSSRLALIPFDAGEIVIPCAARPAGITRLNRSGESSYDQWEWKDAVLTIRVSEDQLNNSAGFLLKR
jgi:hypothetical protein